MLMGAYRVRINRYIVGCKLADTINITARGGLELIDT